MKPILTLILLCCLLISCSSNRDIPPDTIYVKMVSDGSYWVTIVSFLPFLGTILTVIGGYVFLTLQVRKNRRAKWVEDFRRESAHLMWLMQNRNHSDFMYREGATFSGFAKQDELIATAVLVQLFLDQRIEIHKVLYDKLSKFNYFLMEDPTQKVPDLFLIAKLVESILRKEQSKI